MESADIRRWRIDIGAPAGTVGSLAGVNRASLCLAENGQYRLPRDAQQRVVAVLWNLQRLADLFRPVRLDFRDARQVAAWIELLDSGALLRRPAAEQTSLKLSP